MARDTYYGMEIVANYEKVLDDEEFKVIVLDDEEYYNIHVISEKFIDAELNTMKLQIPKESVSADYFTKERLIGYLMEHFIWDRFYDEGIVSASLEIEITPHASQQTTLSY